MGTRHTWIARCTLVLLAVAPAALDLSAARLAVADCAATTKREEASDAARRAARRRWALAKMDEMASERLRCRTRFTVQRQIDECEAGYMRRFREYNELYIEASRE
ncbi:MAG: hypothetical protein ACRELA_07410 [Candidatus Rokuibacteriota bacterium]